MSIHAPIRLTTQESGARRGGSAPATILIIDDEPRSRKLLAMLLEPEGYATREAASGEEALVSIAEHAPDLILLDLILPGLSGHDVARRLKADPATARIPIIMITARVDRADRLAGLKAGAEEFLLKPIERAELWLRVRNLLRLKALGDLLADQSARLEAEVQARTADLQRFRYAMDKTADAIFLIDSATMRLIEANATATEMLGYSRSEFLEMTPADLGGAPLATFQRIYDLVKDSEAPSELSEVRLLRKDGSNLEAEVRRHAIRSGEGWVIAAVVRDITERKAAEGRLHRLAHYDALTGLPNRTLFYETLRKALVRAADLDWTVAVLFIDLDRFKNVNDTLGHGSGDALLRQFADRLVDCVRIRDTIGRLGGDEFALILTMKDAQKGAALVVGKIRAALLEPFDLGGHALTITASIGITIHPDDANDAEALIKFADTAMYRAKQAGRDTYRFFTAEMNAEVLDRLAMEVALRRAIERDEFILYYQPKLRLADDRIIGFEALLRWDRPGVGIVQPGAFVPMLEQTGLIVRVGAWVIGEACRQIGVWLRSDVGPMAVSVNVTAGQFNACDLEGDIVQLLAVNGIPPELLELELTESTLMADTHATMATLKSLNRRGIQISIDDFGTGYSSLAYLRRFTLDKVKIDIDFIRDMITNPDDATMVLAIIKIAHSLRLGVVAEGVETEQQLAFLREHGCDEVQGYYLGRPTTAERAAELIRPQLEADEAVPARTDGAERKAASGRG